LSRTIFLGEPDDTLKRAEAALIEGLEAGLEIARAGNRACDIANAPRRTIRARRHRTRRALRLSHWLSYPPDWGERTISLRPEDQTILQPGMTFHFMPGLWMDDWGLEITESIIIRDEGPAETLCNQPRRMFVK
jgi:ectoine hydrolase